MIKQNTPEWLEAKRSKIGGSEIYSLVYHYCKNELEQINVDLVKDKPFRSALEIYLEKKFSIEGEPISQVNSEFGLGMEDFICDYLNVTNPSITAKTTKEFITTDGLTSCSPDGFIEIKENQQIRDYDDNLFITPKDGRGMLEIKTTQYLFNYEADVGTKWQYIFQLQHNMEVANCDWGILACLTPKEKEYDNDFFKGKIVGRLMEGAKFEDLRQYYNLYTYAYYKMPPIQQLIGRALAKFQKAMDDNVLPAISKDDKAFLTREKKALSQIAPEKYGILQADDKLNNMLEERAIINNELLKCQTERTAIDCEIIKALETHIAVEGLAHKAKFDTRGSLRFSKIN